MLDTDRKLELLVLELYWDRSEAMSHFFFAIILKSHSTDNVFKWLAIEPGEGQHKKVLGVLQIYKDKHIKSFWIAFIMYIEVIYSVGKREKTKQNILLVNRRPRI